MDEASSPTVADNAFTNIDLPASDTLAAGKTASQQAPALRRRWPLVAAGVAGAALVGAVTLALVLSGRKGAPSDSDDSQPETNAERKQHRADEALKLLTLKAADSKTTFAELARDVQAFKAMFSAAPLRQPR